MPSENKAFPELKNDRLLRAARGEEVDKIPVWVMRQAGRYLPEFLALRAKHDFFEVCRTPELACEVTLQPLRRFKCLDASIIFSDILVIPQALGMTVEMCPGRGPVFPEPLNVPEDLNKLTVEGAVSRLLYVGDAITLTRHTIDGLVPLIGFTGAPWTLMGYMIEGGGSKTMAKSKGWLENHTAESHKLLKTLTAVIIEYLLMQVEAGAQLLQVFESSAEHLTPEQFAIFCAPYLKEISSGVKEGIVKKGLAPVPMYQHRDTFRNTLLSGKILYESGKTDASSACEPHANQLTQKRVEESTFVKTVFAKGGGHSLKLQAGLGYEVIGIDWTVDPEKAREDVGDLITLQGNLDPQDLYKEQGEIRELTTTMVRKFGKLRYIANLGHGITPATPIDSMHTFTEAVHEAL